MTSQLHPTWIPALAPELASERFRALGAFVVAERARGTVYPPQGEVFTALANTALPDVRVVILGQDPYHGPGQAHGLAFSVRADIVVPPSLRNILQELRDDLGVPPPASGELTAWAQRGVLLLNTVLTVRAGLANSHAGKGWEEFTDAVIRAVAATPERVVFLLWGSHAQRKLPLLDGTPHVAITSPHPSPLSAHRGFFGSRPFSRANAALRDAGREEIDWRL